MISRIRGVSRRAGDAGASAVEYALMVAAIAAVIVAVVFGFGNLISNTFQGTSNCIENRQTMPNCDPSEATTP
ncbi:Flp family type IVb pilin [Kineosporia succinea]|uniref:Pilus assembly protein Flp/PilA n=1 Tax=Kineosporia succinea TaxID=84632 RepID=A0ABT9P721_9ACTN|nr:Flp family type IVb pilin [Kineosporia succinea]MDP9828242.1 pilus assembly protein Flp/PilA [Kineosporia succinea]